ncbi:MAG: phospholipase D-like domain-containing protein [Edaphobacter sp.]|uniref:phospholipase D-like domain-containing protein n=1 Tax=Edaphobacter sp. TaxID=1934404 RepID=UPI002382DD6E|nr:phospholipase D-like domain-containing protein [Edaphobacter sp.]MDE1178532.1 phospholipase D-like domain-containing protein [Edaphobacter sp.]
MSRTLIVLPDDSARPLLDAIAGAKSSLRIKMFVFSDPSLIDAVVAAHGRGVDVRVMLNPERRDGSKENDEVRERLSAAGVAVLDSNPRFDVTHEKSMVVDDETAYIESLNWEPRNLTETRDYAVVTKHKHEVDEVMAGFDADWNRSEFTSGEKSHLIWCIGNGRQRMCEFIDRAKHTLWLQNERYQDPVVIEHLVRAHARGVKIHIMARPPHKLKKEKLVEGVSGLRILADLGVPIHQLKHIKLHGKVMLADDKRAIVGSINIAPGSFDSRRELAIEVDDDHIIGRVKKTLEHDWENSKILDLSDEGLLAELKNYDPDVVEDLGIGSSHKK